MWGMRAQQGRGKVNGALQEGRVQGREKAPREDAKRTSSHYRRISWLITASSASMSLERKAMEAKTLLADISLTSCSPSLFVWITHLDYIAAQLARVCTSAVHCGHVVNGESLHRGIIAQAAQMMSRTLTGARTTLDMSTLPLDGWTDGYG